MDLKRAFLVVAFAMVSTIALLYGIDPQWFAKTFLGVTDLDASFAHILRAVMGLYLALGLFWLYCALTGKYKNLAVLTTILFAGGLLIGRLVSLATDGLPAPLLIVYAGIEAAVIPLAVWIYRLPE